MGIHLHYYYCTYLKIFTSIRLKSNGLANPIYSSTHPRSDPTLTLRLSDHTVWIHLASKAGQDALPIACCGCSLAME
jgi:hypothetical protein